MANIAIFRINYKSDFILTLESDAGWMTPFCIKFWTGAPSQAYFARWDGTTYTNCEPVEGEPTKLRVQFDDHKLPIGTMKYQVGYHFTVSDFPTTIEDEVINQADVIIEVDGEPAQVMLDFNGETAPEIQFSLPAYANEVARIENELQRQENELAREQASAAAVAGAENVNAQLSGTILTVTNRNGVSTSSNVQGPQGQQGPAGQDGADGVGVPEGGTTGQVLKKKSNTDYDTEWADESGGGGSQVQSNWTETNTSSPAYIKNKPNLATVATSGSYNDLSNKPTIPAAQIQSDWNQTNTSAKDYIKNKPTIPAAQIQSDWTQTNTSSKDYIKNKPSLATVATSGSYNDLSNKPSIPAAQVNSDWNASSGVAQILNKPTIPDVSGKQDKMSIVAGSGTTLSAAINTYYNFASEVGTLAVTLPTVTDTTHIQNIVFMLTTGASPAVTFAGASGINVIAQDGFSIEASTTYEINAIFNGTKWVLAAMKLNTTDIQPSNE